MTAQEILTLAASQLGIKESPPNSNNVKYNTAYYGRAVSGSAYPWCCAFVWWLFRELEASDLFYGGQKTASCTTLYNYYKSKGQTVPISEARPGDLVFFVFDGNKQGIKNHIGVCESCGGGYITTIDGNTGTTSEANGGAVMRRKRALSYVGGVARPKYKEGTEGKPSVPSGEQTVSGWAAASWGKAVGKGVFDGTEPGGSLTREQAAVVLDRLGLLG